MSRNRLLNSLTGNVESVCSHRGDRADQRQAETKWIRVGRGASLFTEVCIKRGGQRADYSELQKLETNTPEH